MDWLKGREEARTLLAGLLEEGLAISIITSCEIYDGVYGSSDPSKAEREFMAFLRGARVLGISRAVARKAADLRGDLRRRGLLLAMPDILIAATAFQHNLALVTRNVEDFERFSDLRIRA